MKIDSNKFSIEEFLPIIWWYECSVCSSEFRREWGWQVKGLYPTRQYVCNKCASSRSEVILKLKQKETVDRLKYNKKPNF